MAKYPKKPGAKPATAGLTEMQWAFVRYKAQGMNGTAAARHAGYTSPSSDADALLKSEKVKVSLAKEQAKYEKSSDMSRKKVMDGLQYAINQAVLIAEPMAQIKGWSEIAKMCGYYEAQKHKIEVSVNGQVVIQRLQTLSDVELLALAEGRTIEGELVPEQLPDLRLEHDVQARGLHGDTEVPLGTLSTFSVEPGPEDV